MAKLGRPPLDANDPSVHVGVSLPSKKFDELCDKARRNDVTLSEMLRRMIYGQPAEKKSKNSGV
jgi:hypothetical protein